ncbi:MAG: DUF4364 family protein [Clostridia bacterium]|nr:DUF4364 family protein [Clostridia bacterium]
MEKDASSAGVDRVGGLFSTTEIRILVCYILNAMPVPVPADLLVSTLHTEGIANGFEVSDALAHLIEKGHLVLVDEKDDSYTVTDSGKRISDELQSSLSYAVKNRGYNVTLKMVSRFYRAKDHRFSVSHEKGNTYITCSAMDHELPFLSIKLLVADEGQANMIKERFLDLGNDLYSTIIHQLTNPK